MGEEDPLATFIPATKALIEAQPNLAYIHVVEARITGAVNDANPSVADAHPSDPIRNIVDASPNTKYIAAGGFTPELAESTIEKFGGLVAFGRYYIGELILRRCLTDRSQPRPPSAHRQGGEAQSVRQVHVLHPWCRRVH